MEWFVSQDLRFNYFKYFDLTNNIITEPNERLRDFHMSVVGKNFIPLSLSHRILDFPRKEGERKGTI